MACSLYVFRLGDDNLVYRHGITSSHFIINAIWRVVVFYLFIPSAMVFWPIPVILKNTSNNVVGYQNLCIECIL